MLKIGIIGPTNLLKISKIIGKPVSFLRSKGAEIGRLAAENNAEIWINSDNGITMEAADGYKKHGGKKLVMLFSVKDEPWPNQHSVVFTAKADVLRKEKNWFWANYNVVSLPDVCVCAGLSAGTLCELAYIKWDVKLNRGKLKKLVAIKELLRDRKLPPEIEMDVKKILVYIDKVEDLASFLAKMAKKDKNLAV